MKTEMNIKVERQCIYADGYKNSKLTEYEGSILTENGKMYLKIGKTGKPYYINRTIEDIKSGTSLAIGCGRTLRRFMIIQIC